MAYIFDLFYSISFLSLPSLIVLKTVNTFIYLMVSYFIGRYQVKPVIALGNYLRLLGALADFAILLILIIRYVWEGCVMAYAFSILGVLFSVILCATSWLVLARQGEVKSVLIIGIFCLIILLVLHLQFLSMGFMYKGPMAALFVFNITYIACWLVFDAYPKTITTFMERVGEKLIWVDLLIGSIPHNDLALRNVCSFNLGLLNLAYIHTSGGAMNIIILIVIGLGLLTNILIGLRLIKASASVKLYNGFMVQIIINGYNNIVIIYDQLKNKALPKATWYGGVLGLTMGLNFISPSYCMTSTEGLVIDASLTGEQQTPEGASSPVSEGARGSRLEPGVTYARDVSAGVVATGVAAGIQQVVTTATNPESAIDQQAGTELTASQLQAANERADLAEARLAQTEAELAHLKRSWLYRMCPACFRVSSTSNDVSNNSRI